MVSWFPSGSGGSTAGRHQSSPPRRRGSTIATSALLTRLWCARQTPHPEYLDGGAGDGVFEWWTRWTRRKRTVECDEDVKVRQSKRATALKPHGLCAQPRHASFKRMIPATTSRSRPPRISLKRCEADSGTRDDSPSVKLPRSCTLVTTNILINHCWCAIRSV